MITCITDSRKPYINGEKKSKRSQFNYTYIVLTNTMNLLAVVTPPYIFITIKYIFEDFHIQLSFVLVIGTLLTVNLKQNFITVRVWLFCMNVVM